MDIQQLEIFLEDFKKGQIHEDHRQEIISFLKYLAANSRRRLLKTNLGEHYAECIRLKDDEMRIEICECSFFINKRNYILNVMKMYYDKAKVCKTKIFN